MLQTGHSGRHRFDRLIDFLSHSRQKSADDRRGAVTKFADTHQPRSGDSGDTLNPHLRSSLDSNGRNFSNFSMTSSENSSTQRLS